MKLTAFSFVLILIPLVLSTTTHAQSPRFDHLSYSDGLPSFTVWDIAIDNEGYVWLGTSTGLARYDNFTLQTVNPDNIDWSVDPLRALHFDSHGQLWVGTDGAGLATRTSKGEWISYRHDKSNTNSISSDRVFSITSDDSDRIWVGTDNGLNTFDTTNGQFTRYQAGDTDNQDKVLADNNVRDLYNSVNGSIWVATYNGLMSLNPDTGVFRSIDVGESNLQVYTVYETPKGTVWLGTATGLFQYDPRTRTTSKAPEPLTSKRIVSIEHNSAGLWFGSLGDGLFRLSDQNLVTSYSAKADRYSLADNVGLTLLTDDTGVLWIGTFNNGVSKLNTHELGFGRYDRNGKSTSCMGSNVVFSFNSDSRSGIWIGTDSGLAYLDRKNKTCKWYKADAADATTVPRNIASITFDPDGNLYLAGNGSLARLNIAQELVTQLANPAPSFFVNFTYLLSNGNILAGSRSGLFRYNPITKNWFTVDTKDTELSDANFFDISLDSTGKLWFATSVGIASFTEGSVSELLRHAGKPTIENTITEIFVDHLDTIWVVVNYGHLSNVHTNGTTLATYNNNPEFPVFVTAIQEDEYRSLWISSTNGLYVLDRQRAVIKRYKEEDGLQSNAFTLRSAHTNANGELFFGGRQGFNAFFPSELRANSSPPTPIFTKLIVNNKPAPVGKIGQEFSLYSPLNETDELFFNHTHRMFNIEFAALNITDAKDVSFSYKLDGFDESWNDVLAPQRSATYTNLKPGKYEFRLRARTDNDVWSVSDKTIPITIQSAPWASWQARLLYIVLSFGLISIFLTRRTAARRKYAEELKREVKSRTREVQQQKETIEEILAKKNSLFENISHEFRTPLTLLIGPLENLRERLVNDNDTDTVSLALRNAKRLLAMIDQLLKLSEVTHGAELQKSVRPLAPVLHILVASFTPAAKLRNIALTNSDIPDVNVRVSEDALEVVFGNLLSNAIKYTHKGGTIQLNVKETGDQVQIDIVDNGSGIANDQLEHIFDRFSRLPEHHNKPGTGLGLAVTKEVIEANLGTISVTSTPGQGSCFSVTLPVTVKQTDAYRHSEIDSSQFTNEIDATTTSDAFISSPLDIESVSETEHDQTPIVLCIDDNADILKYLESILSSDYQFIGAPNGTAGIQAAREAVPDLIICDVMMPDMDGFQVSRTLRGDEATSHIPIVLLTARNDQDSRLRGWEASVDDYIQKPFNDKELKSRISNLLSIRRILQGKLNEHINTGKPVETHDGINPTDKEFLKKLQNTVEEFYSQPDLDRAKLASVVNVSERQLQRKMKALIDCNPVDFVRDYRLGVAAQKIREGQQISLVSHDCGFSSGSYFSRCFKTRYGQSPKQYQTQNIGR